MSAEIDRLTARQKEMLDLVAAGVTSSKAISARIGIEPKTIDNHLINAARHLSARTREDAARRYRDLVEGRSPDPSPGRTAGVAERPGLSFLGVVTAGWRGAQRLVRSTWAFLRGPPFGSEMHQLSWSQMVLQVLRVAIIGLLGISAVALFTLGLFQTVGWFVPP